MAFAAAFSALQAENSRLKRELEQKEAELAVVLGESRLQVCTNNVLDLPPEIGIAGKMYRFPSESEQHERAVWRNVEFSKHLRATGRLGKLIPTSYVIDWFKKTWFGDHRSGEARLVEAGFTPEQLESLTVHHIVARKVSACDSIHNYHLMLQSVNAHFGSFYSKEMVRFVGYSNADVACRASRRLSAHAALDDSYDELRFDPYAIDCPRRPPKRPRRQDPCARPSAPTLVIPVRPSSPISDRFEELEDTEPTYDAEVAPVEKASDPYDAVVEWMRQHVKKDTAKFAKLSNIVDRLLEHPEVLHTIVEAHKPTGAKRNVAYAVVKEVAERALGTGSGFVIGGGVGQLIYYNKKTEIGRACGGVRVTGWHLVGHAVV